VFVRKIAIKVDAMKTTSVTTLIVLLCCVGLTQSATDVDEFDLVFQHIDVLKSHVTLLKSRKSTKNSVFTFQTLQL